MDPDELRASYLGDLASVCHLGPQQVDALRYADFLSLMQYVDSYYEALKKVNSGDS